ncbi:MAG: acyl-CoA/acyl-ACP dehydrogenase, partial [Candidatus Obscuribacterales bacterium]|nr:acyl-CoA/acyl-ACP dehydrogenase [Candidatus Obscuribacterales bacterium]
MSNKNPLLSSPIFQAVWGHSSAPQFALCSLGDTTAAALVQERTLALLRQRKADGVLYGEDGKITQASMDAIGTSGYWGMLVPREYGGIGLSFNDFCRTVTNVAAAGFPTEGGIAGMHGCIGAVFALSRFGTEEQKSRYLPLFASGQRTSGFALTEPCAGSDLGSLRTTARLEGDEYVINGEKLFNGNCLPTRVIRLVARVEGEDKPSEFIVELPQENEHFQLVRYKLLAVRQGRNNGLKFTNFRVPASSRLPAPEGNSLATIYAGLNFGRVAVAANCAGVMRLLLGSLCPWTGYRETFGELIETREKVKLGVGRLASLIVGADAIRDFCAGLLDSGERAELECIIAKTFCSTALKEAFTDISLMIHGGRSFLEDHIIGPNMADYLAPLIYEGQNDMLSMKFFATLAKEHGLNYMLPLGESLKALRSGKIFSGAVSFLKAATRLSIWKLKNRARSNSAGLDLDGMDARLAGHTLAAMKALKRLAAEISGKMSKHGARLAERQGIVVQLSQQVQDAILMLVVAQHAQQLGDETTILAADVLCRSLEQKLTGKVPDEAYFAACSKLGHKVLNER